jgi:predicted phosphoribosyltransferase
MISGRPFPDRAAAGALLGERLAAYAGRSDVLVLALPRGGVPVGYQVARRLQAPLDVIVVRKLGVPFESELAMGAIASGGIRVLNPDVVGAFGIDEEVIARCEARERKELERREKAYRGERPAPEVAGRVVILVDDGIATGSTIRAAVAALRAQKPARLVIGVPVASAAACRQLRAEADEVVAVLETDLFFAIGEFYETFPQTSDDEVRELLSRSVPEPAAPA